MAELRAETLATPWIAAAKSTARLIAAPGPDGAYRAGVEIRLDRGALTYWRTPGEAGASPVFDFDRSENVKSAKVLYPAPARIDEAGFDMFGYRDSVTFPVDVELIDASRPAVLALSLDYAVCSDICVPAQTKAALDLPAWPGPAAAEQRGLLDAARALVPRRLGAAERDARFSIARVEGATPPTWRVRLKGEPDGAAAAEPQDRGADLFVEYPEGYYFTAKKSAAANEFLLVEVEAPRPSGPDANGLAAAMIPLTVTVAQPRQSYEFELNIEPAEPRP